MKSKKPILVVLILLWILMAASMIPEAGAITPQSQTVKITDTNDDMFITEVGIGIDSSLVTIKDPEMDIRAFLVFRELDINYWEPLKNATLRLRTSNTLSFDADSSISIYGMALSDLQVEGYLLPSTVLSIGFTDAYTNYNTSEFYGGQWHEINVTSIVEELIRNPNWDGDGGAGTETGDAIGFHLVGPEGDDKRYFYDFSVGNGFEAQLVIHWNHEPPPPAGYPVVEFNSTYRGYNLWIYRGSNFEIHTIDYRGWNINTIAGGALLRYNTTGINPFGVGVNADQFRMVNASVNSPFGNNGSLVIRVDVYGVTNFGGADLNRLNFAYLFFGNLNGSVIANHGGPGFEGLGLLFRHNADNATDDIFRYSTYVDSGLGVGTDSSDHYKISDTPHFLNITWDFAAQFFRAEIYQDEERTILLDTVQQGPGYAGIEATGYDFHFPFNTYTLGMGLGTVINATMMSDTLEASLNTTWIVTDENGTIIETGLEDYEGALIVIDDILGADPEDPNPPGEGWTETGPFTRFRTRLYILMMGFGLVFGPLLYFAMSRPSGYEFVIGLFIMFVGYAFLRAAAGI